MSPPSSAGRLRFAIATHAEAGNPRSLLVPPVSPRPCVVNRGGGGGEADDAGAGARFDGSRIGNKMSRERAALGRSWKLYSSPNMNLLTLDSTKTALVLIDLQKGIVGRPSAPRSGVDVVRNGARLAARFRELGALVVLVRVAFQPDFKDYLDLPVDAAVPFNPGALPADWTELAPAMGPQPGDLVITKRHWGAFHGTELDLQLRRRGGADNCSRGHLHQHWRRVHRPQRLRACVCAGAGGGRHGEPQRRGPRICGEEHFSASRSGALHG